VNSKPSESVGELKADICLLQEAIRIRGVRVLELEAWVDRLTLERDEWEELNSENADRANKAESALTAARAREATLCGALVTARRELVCYERTEMGCSNYSVLEVLGEADLTRRERCAEQKGDDVRGMTE
jgi:hypothetical protein